MHRGPPPRRAILVGLGLVALSVLALLVDGRGGAPGPAGRTLSYALAPLQSLVTAAGTRVRGVWLGYVALTGVREQNEALQEEIRTLRDKAAAADDLTAENARLRRLLDMGDRRKDLRLRAARVVSRSTSPYFRVMRIVLDLDADGVREGMPVIAPGGVVGQIRSVYGGRAEVLLVTDPRSAIDVVLEQSRARGVAVGTGEPDRYAARLKYLRRNAASQEGERVLTTGDDGRYPRGLVVGRVSKVVHGAQGPFQRAELEPLVDLSALDEVFISLGPSGLTPDGEGIARKAGK